MVIYVNKWNVKPETVDAYQQWTPGAIERNFSVPGIQEFNAYRMVAGSHQVVAVFKFDDLESWAKWREAPEIVAVFEETRAFVTDYVTELWGPSPIVQQPVQPE